MSADLLREAATEMRSRATSARAGRWQSTGWRVDATWSDGARYVAECDSMGGPLNARHIASWDPAVAFAVADWLERVAVMRDEAEGTALALVVLGITEPADAVARTYLGESA